MSKDELARTQIRMPADLHAKLNDAATAAGRSFNGEMVARLEESFTQSEALAVRMARIRADWDIMKNTILSVNLALKNQQQMTDFLQREFYKLNVDPELKETVEVDVAELKKSASSVIQWVEEIREHFLMRGPEPTSTE